MKKWIAAVLGTLAAILAGLAIDLITLGVPSVPTLLGVLSLLVACLGALGPSSGPGTPPMRTRRGGPPLHGSGVHPWARMRATVGCC